MEQANTSSRVLTWVLSAVLALSIAAGMLWQSQQWQAAHDFNCADPLRGCTLPLSTAQLRFLSLPRPVTPFEIRITGLAARKVTLRLGMVGMDMGPQLLTFRALGGGQWSAQAWLPVCVQGRRDWRALLEVDGQRYQFAFVTE